MSAFILYAINYDARQIEYETRQLSYEIERTRRDIAVLKAERALLASPQRIARLARQLKLRPAEGDQFYILPKIGAPGELTRDNPLPARLR